MLAVPAVHADEQDPGGDTRNLAAKRGVPVEVVQKETEWQEAFNHAVQEIEAKFPESYADAIVDPCALSGEIWFVGDDVPSGVHEILGGMIESVTLTTGERLSRQELAKRVAEAHFSAYRDARVDHAPSYAGDDRESVIINVGLASSVSSAEESDLVAEVQAKASESSGLRVEVNAVDWQGSVDMSTRGGAWFDRPFGTMKCNHCADAGNPLVYRNHGSSSSTNLPLASSVGSHGWDAAW